MKAILILDQPREQSEGETGVEYGPREQDGTVLLLNLPCENGEELRRKLRDEWNIPVVAASVSGKRETGSREEPPPLDLGALRTHLDQYIFRPEKAGDRELQEPEMVRQGSVCLYPRSHRTFVRGKQVELKNREFELLLYLMRHVDQVFSVDHLYSTLWGEGLDGNRKTVTVHINRIRQKIEKNPAKPRYLQTVWGLGYRFKA